MPLHPPSPIERTHLCGKTIAGKEVLDDLVTSCGVVVEVEAVTGVGLNEGLEGRRSGERGLGASRDVGTGDVLSHAVAVAAAEGNVVLTAHDNNGSSEHGHLGCVADGHDLSSSDRLLGLLALNSEANVEHAREQEGVLKRG